MGVNVGAVVALGVGEAVRVMVAVGTAVRVGVDDAVAEGDGDAVSVGVAPGSSGTQKPELTRKVAPVEALTTGCPMVP